MENAASVATKLEEVVKRARLTDDAAVVISVQDLNRMLAEIRTYHAWRQAVDSIHHSMKIVLEDFRA